MMPINTTLFKNKLAKLELIRAKAEDALADMVEELGDYVPGSKKRRKFFNSPRKAQETKLVRISKSIRELESGYNERYNYYAAWRDKKLEVASDIEQLNNRIQEIQAKLFELRSRIIIALDNKEQPTLEHLVRIGEISDLNKELIQAIEKRDRKERHLENLEAKSIQTLLPLHELRTEIYETTLKDVLPEKLHIIRDAAIAHRDGRISIKEQKEKPSAFDIIKNTPKFEFAGGIRPAEEQTATNHADGFLDMLKEGLFDEPEKKDEEK